MHRNHHSPQSIVIIHILYYYTNIILFINNYLVLAQRHCTVLLLYCAVRWQHRDCHCVNHVTAIDTVTVIVYIIIIIINRDHCYYCR